MLTRFSRLAVFLLFTLPAWCQFVKGRYIVELTDPPASAVDTSAAPSAREASPLQQRAMTPAARREAALQGRDAVRSRQQAVRARVIAEGAQVTESIDLLGNALFVNTDEAGAARLASVPGVRRVSPMRLFKPLLDRAVIVHQVDKVWARVGLDHAGDGIKIGIVDSGVDNNHPGLRDSSLPAVDGFPKTNRDSDLAFTNNKVIAARSYVSLLSRRDTDLSARDHVGHGTALAMIAAGNTNTGPLGAITGVAPKAYIGSYKIFGTPNQNDSASEAAILKAIEDAVADGMDVLNLSFGSIFAPRLEDDLEVTAIERASQLGVIVVAAAGNQGPDWNTLSSPATSPSAIAVGASLNDRGFASKATVTGLDPLIAVNSDRPPAAAVTGPLVDLESVDSTALACNPLPASSLTGKVVLILRGVCTFEVKLTYAARAGAIGALVYTDEARPDAISMTIGTATLPAQMLSYTDGVAVKNAIKAANGSATATLTFALSAVPVNPNRMASFSSAGPPVGLNIKPEVVAVGENFYTATQTFDRNGDMYTASGYIVVDGTSFATPFTAGVAALMKALHPGLTVDQYRSMIINNAKPMPAMNAQVSGAGMVNALAADRATIVASPATLSYGAGGGTINLPRKIAITNLSGVDDTFTMELELGSGTGAPYASQSIRSIPAGATVSFDISFQEGNLPPGTYQGYLAFQGTSSGARIRVPYWYAVKSPPAGITVIWIDDSPVSFASNQDAVIFRVTDASGVALLDVQPEVTVVSGTASVVSVSQIDSDLPGAYSVTIRYGSVAAASVLEIKAGDATIQLTVP
jgi:subtilisin family serine protease